VCLETLSSDFAVKVLRNQDEAQKGSRNVRRFDIAVMLLACATVEPIVQAQQLLQASPTVSDRACSFADQSVGSMGSNLAPPRTTPSSDSPAATNANALNAQAKLICYAKVSYAWPSLVAPIFATSKKMIFPPQAYPREWKNGFGAVARNYGDALTNDAANRAGRYLSAVILHEDTRYWPSENKCLLARIFNVISFAVADKSDSGKRMPAISTFAGAAAGGFVGNAYLPQGYDNVTHAGQRSAIQLAESPLPNLVCEFTPEFRKALEWVHVGALNDKLFKKCNR
jgi:hypothetical protein